MEKEKKQRTCIACGVQKQKKDLFRIVRNKQGEVSLDLYGKAAGRGAYVCSINCLEKAAATKGFDRALRTRLDSETMSRIVLQLNEAMREA